MTDEAPMSLREFLDQREQELIPEIAELQKRLIPLEAELAEVRGTRQMLDRSSSKPNTEKRT